VLDRELVDYLDLALWDSAQVVRDGAFRGRTMLSVFTDLPRRGVRVGVAGRITSARRARELLAEGVDFVLIGRAAILRRDFPHRVASYPSYESPRLPVTAQFLREGGLSARFVQHMRRWPYFLEPERVGEVVSR
jgi:2,4-dienoyl-CoA reductase-like NADH-dependent reductase (Old Yellow Enzyme family)